jgi:hypothetical protein
MATSITSLRNPIDDLTSKLNEPPTKPVGALEQEFGGMAQRGARARELAPQMMRESLKQEQKVGEDIMQQRTQSAEDIGNLAKRQAASTKLLEEEAIAARPEPIEFAPTQQTPEQLQTIAISMMLVGALAGGGAKRSGIAGLKAMTGMLDGYKQGRKDVFDREKIIFEKALETQKQKIEEVKAMYESAVRAKLAGDQAEYNSLQARIQAETDNGTMQYAFATRNTDQVRKQLEAAEISMAKGLEGMEKLRKAEEDRKLRQKEIDARKQDYKVIGTNEEGDVVMANDLGQTRVMTGVAPASGARATQQQSIAQRAVNSLGGVASALESLKELPAGTTTGLLPNLQTKDGMFNYVRNTMGRKISSRDAEMMNTLFTGIGRNLASIESSGIATGLVELSKQMQSGTYINSGIDDPYKVAIKLADIRRIATENIRPAIESGLMPKQQAQTAMKLVERIEQAIPYETVDVVRAANAKGRPTIGERTTQVVQGGENVPTFATEKEAQAARDRNEISAGTKIRIGNKTGEWRD